MRFATLPRAGDHGTTFSAGDICGTAIGNAVLRCQTPGVVAEKRRNAFKLAYHDDSTVALMVEQQHRSPALRLPRGSLLVGRRIDANFDAVVANDRERPITIFTNCRLATTNFVRDTSV